MAKTPVNRVQATKRKRSKREPRMTEIIFKFKSIDIKRAGGLEKFCDLVYSMVDAVVVSNEN